MALIGSVDGVKRLLQAVEGDDFGGDQETRIADTLAAVTSLIQDRIGIVYDGEELTTESIVVRSYGVTPDLWLPKPIVDLDSVQELLTWNGAAWSGTAIANDLYFLGRRDDRPGAPYRSISYIPGYLWSGDYLVTGTWADADLAASIPADLAYVGNYVTAEIYKKQSASPAGFAGPDGTVVLFRNALNEPEIKALLDLHARARPTSVVV